MIPVFSVGDLPFSRPDPAEVTSVVLVDDDADFRWVIRRQLERTGEFSVVGEAADGAAGVEVAAVLRPDLVLLDLEMPYMDGLEALPLVYHRSPWSTVVMLTAMSSGVQLDAALRGGAAGIIRKGSSLANMVAQLRGLVGLAHLHEIQIEGVG
jgi:two-component system, NarL family, nitrate/nitrite response regulator NarL